MNILYIEAFSGLSGDMFLGALAGLTNGYDELEKLPKALHLPDAKVEISQVDKNGIVCKHVKVIDLNEVDGHSHEQTHDQKHTHDHDHSHDHSHSHNHSHNHVHRHLSDILNIIKQAHISEGAKDIANKIFHIIGISESTIHDIPLEKIHFHEISAVDSLVDIIGCAVLLDKLNISKTYATSVCTGFGFVNTQHGKLPVPAPATNDILKGIPTYPGDEKGERTTPTGAAILKYLNPDFTIPTLTTKKIAYGPGQKDFIAPNVIRASLCETKPESEELYILETNIDDMPAEFLGLDFQNELMEHGAIDFYFTPVQMKKGRAGQMLSCFVEQEKLDSLSDYILENTSSIGVRYSEVKRKTLNRAIREVDTKYGKARVKTVTTPSGIERSTVEYDDLNKLSKENNVSLQEINREILSMLSV